MRKARVILQETADNREFKSAIGEINKKCPLCANNRGCNRNRDYKFNWKAYRANQWKEKGGH